jgi:beta-glucanase (GH16 family)
MPNRKAAATVVYEDDFDALDLSKYLTRWWYTPPTDPGCSLPSNGELQLYVNAEGPLYPANQPWTVKDSILSLTATPDTSQPGFSYLSGMINTYPGFNRIYGYWEVRAKMPPGAGMWPAFWLLPYPEGWPPEIDVVEWLGREPRIAHCGTHSTGTPSTQDGSYPIPDGSADFHTYGVDWQANQITFYFDGVNNASFPTPSDMNRPMYAILNLAIGGGWAGPPDADTVFPASFDVDYLKVWDICPYDPTEKPPIKPPEGTGQTFVIDNPWSAVDLRGTFGVGDTVALRFHYDDLFVLIDPTSTQVWARTGASMTLAVILPVRVTRLG